MSTARNAVLNRYWNEQKLSPQGYTPETEAVPYEGRNSWNDKLVIAFMILCIIGIIVALVGLLTGKKYKNKFQASTSSSKSKETKKESSTAGYSSVPTNV